MALGRVYCFGRPSAPRSRRPRRHLTEFWMVEPEMAYADLNDVMELAEIWSSRSWRACSRSARPELK
jgi:asparaginyl-tRNA synthetase